MKLFPKFFARLADRIADRVAGVVLRIMEGLFHVLLTQIRNEGAKAVTAYNDAKASLDKLATDLAAHEADEQTKFDAAIAKAVADATAAKDVELAAKEAEMADMQARIDALDATVVPAV